MLACFNQMIRNLSRKVDGIVYDVQDLKTSINFISDNDTEGKFINIPKREWNTILWNNIKKS